MSSAASSSTSSKSNSNEEVGPVGGIPDALLERMMDRKLRMLDLEYEECLKATKSRNPDDYDQGPKGDDWEQEIEVDPEVARASGYEAFGGAVIPGEGMDLSQPETLSSDEWSEAWATYQKECQEEEEEARQKGITDADVQNQTAPDQPAAPPKPLSKDALASIAKVMSGIKLKPPMWALNIPEEVWMSQILSRAGYRPKPTSSSSSTSTSTTSSNTALATDEQKTKRKKKKKTKSKATTATDSTTAAADADFEAVFPPVTSTTGPQV